MSDEGPQPALEVQARRRQRHLLAVDLAAAQPQRPHPRRPRVFREAQDRVVHAVLLQPGRHETAPSCQGPQFNGRRGRIYSGDAGHGAGERPASGSGRRRANGRAAVSVRSCSLPSAYQVSPPSAKFSIQLLNRERSPRAVEGPRSEEALPHHKCQGSLVDDAGGDSRRLRLVGSPTSAAFRTGARLTRGASTERWRGSPESRDGAVTGDNPAGALGCVAGTTEPPASACFGGARRSHQAHMPTSESTTSKPANSGPWRATMCARGRAEPQAPAVNTCGSMAVTKSATVGKRASGLFDKALFIAR